MYTSVGELQVRAILRQYNKMVSLGRVPSVYMQVQAAPVNIAGSMADINAAPAVTVLQLQDGTFTFPTPAAELVTVPTSCMHRSALLQDLADNSGDATAVEVPVPPAALELWVHHIQATCGHECTEHTAGHISAICDASGQMADSASHDLGIEAACALLVVRLRSLRMCTHVRAGTLQLGSLAFSLQPDAEAAAATTDTC